MCPSLPFGSCRLFGGFLPPVPPHLGHHRHRQHDQSLSCRLFFYVITRGYKWALMVLKLDATHVLVFLCSDTVTQTLHNFHSLMVVVSTTLWQHDFWKETAKILHSAPLSVKCPPLLVLIVPVPTFLRHINLNIHKCPRNNTFSILIAD